jgi:hypothetical protein
VTRRKPKVGGARAGAGRPRSLNPRRNKVTVKLTDGLHAAVQAAAAAEERKVSEWGAAAFELAIARGSTR